MMTEPYSSDATSVNKPQPLIKPECVVWYRQVGITTVVLGLLLQSSASPRRAHACCPSDFFIRQLLGTSWQWFAVDG